jgi:4-aminobutyrate aminotransferase/(S)-3-amino-2-methylpropionate transaminase
LSFRAPFAEQLGVPVTFAEYPSAQSLDASMEGVRGALRQGNVGAILVEPILGRGGCVVPPVAFLRELRAAADAAGALLITDEIWTGMGRSGAMLASEASGVLPDIVCLGKGLGGGIPISACVGRNEVMQAWAKHGGSAIHTGTHFGSPSACAAALATIESVRTRNLPGRAADVGGRWLEQLARVAPARGRGLMVGVELPDSGKALSVARALLQRGYIVLTGGVQGNVLTLTPPLTIDETLLEAFTRELASLV